MLKSCLLGTCLLLVMSPVVGAEAPLLEVKHSGVVQAVVWSADGKTLVTGGGDGTVQLTSFPQGKQIAHIAVGNPVGGVALSQDGKLLGVKEQVPNGQLGLWDLGTRTLKRKLGFQGYNANQLAFTSDSLVAAGPGEHMVFNFTKGGGYGSRSGKVPEGSFAAVSPNGQIAAWSNPQGFLNLYYTDQRRYQRVAIGPARTMAFSPDAQFMATAGDDKAVRLLDISGKEVRKLEGLREPATRLTFSGNGKVLAAAFEKDPVIRLWEVNSGRLHRRLTGNAGAVTAMALAPDGRSLAVAAGNNVLVWNVATRDLGKLGPPVRLSPEELKSSWADLAEQDYARAEAAFKKLASAGHHALDFLKGKIRAVAVPPIDWKKVDQLLADLDDPAFAVRFKATVELGKLGELIQVPLQKFLEKRPSLEAQRRAGRLLERLRDPELTPDRLRALEAIEILELLRTVEARELLDELARDALISQIRAAANEAVDRLKRTSQPNPAPEKK